MPARDALERLCDAYGIAVEYVDIRGERHSVPEATLRALLGAIGVDAGSNAGLCGALAAAERAAWMRVLEPVQVARDGNEAIQVPVTLPASNLDARFDWVLATESGERYTGRVCVQDLPAVERHTIGNDSFVRHTLVLPCRPAIGYHRFELHQADAQPGPVATMPLIVAPHACYRPQAITDGARVWGLSAQLYAVRSQRNWGIGDFGDLAALIDLAREEGAALIALNPLHALFPDNPEHASPYGPSSRLFLDVWYLDIEAIAEFAECEAVRETVRSPEFQARLRALRAPEMVQYRAVAAAKLEILERLFEHFRTQHLEAGTERARAFRAFEAERGEPLRRQALFDALHEHFRRGDPALWGWPAWPEPYRDPASSEVAVFFDAGRVRVDFFAWLQWLAHLQLDTVGRRALAAGLGVGLQLDLAVGVDPGGADTWGDRERYAVGAGIGAPPDEVNLHGQDWGLAPLIPHRLRDDAYAGLIAILRAAMREDGALRIDHVMGLQRQFWVPHGARPSDGAYVHYGFDELLGIVALESVRNRCLVVGEDLGTVPDGVRDALHARGVLSYRLLYFEKDAEGTFKTPADYPSQALVAVSTHDLPTLCGFWQGADVALRTELGLFPTPQQREQCLVDRAQDRVRLLMALEREGLLPPGSVSDLGAMPELPFECVVAVHRFIARTPSGVMLMQLDDLFGLREQINLPGTTEGQHPNWRRKLPLDLEEWHSDPRVGALAEALRQERGAAVAPRPEALARGPGRRHGGPPRATYRLQFNRDFTFAQATAIVPYLARLGISHCYASPYLKARPGSRHGYDIVDHRELNPEIGSDADFDRFVAALHEHGMGQILDIVPNHMGVMSNDNPWWLDVLENGPASAHARFFDIDWFPYQDELRGKLLLPVLADHYGNVLDDGGLRLVFDAEAGAFHVAHQHHRFPVDPATYPRILGEDRERLAARLGSDHPQVLEFENLVAAFGHLPGRTETDAERLAERRRDKEILERRLAECCAGSADIAMYVAENTARFDPGAADVEHRERLHDLLEAQAYRLAYWRVAADEINYRRFFDINELAALRMEHEEVFEATHRRVLDLLAAGSVDGLRIDHPDGLYDPAQYFHRLQQRAGGLVGAAADGGRGDGGGAPAQHGAIPLYVVVEKILAAHERLPEAWPVAGTTGYDFLNELNGLFVVPAAAGRLDRCYAAFTGARTRFDELVHASKRLIIKVAMTGELNVLAQQLSRIAQADRRTRDFTLNSLRSALAEIVACFPVYRTYVCADSVAAQDVEHVDQAVQAAKRRTRAEDVGVFDFIREVLLKLRAEGRSQPYRDAVTDFAMKFQQYTSPVMAKGLEDTAFYLYHRLVSLNEVGGDPRRFGVSPEAFHRASRTRLRRFPHAMLATSTHDTKRSEDVRARLNVLSELPDAWRQAVMRWRRINGPLKRTVAGRRVPDRNDEYLFYQTLVGVWPLHEPDDAERASFAERIESYMLKAVREGKVNSSWTLLDPDYERALCDFVRRVLDAGTNARFFAEFGPLAQRIARLGMFNSLSQVLIKLTVPGVPDTYQGTEIWDFSLVDPDNRRPVAFDRRDTMLAALERAFDAPAHEQQNALRTLLAELENGAIKLFVDWRTLSIRRRYEALFRDGDYIALEVKGERATHVVAFARARALECAIVVAPRWFASLLANGDALPVGEGVWGDTCVVVPFESTGTIWRNVFTDEVVPSDEHDGVRCLSVAMLLRQFPWALLMAHCDAPGTI